MRYVLAAAEDGGFRRAARRLGVQQSAVSRRIHELEERLGARIFERGPHGVRLTTAGREFVDGAQCALAELDRVVDFVADAGRLEHGVLRIGVAGALAAGPLDDVLRRALSRDPDLVLDMVEGDAAAQIDRLAKGRLDVAFLVAGHDRPVGVAAWRERLLLALPTGHVLERRASIRWTELQGLKLLLPADPDLHAIVQRRARGVAEVSWSAQAAGPATVLRLVSLGQGVGLVPETAATRVNGVVYRPVFREFLAYQAVAGRGPLKPALRRLLALLAAGDPKA